MTTITFNKSVFAGKTAKENDAALKELTSKNDELKEQIAALQEQLAQNNDNQ